jgi:uncharacterized peroxidase-related enzyme
LTPFFSTLTPESGVRDVLQLNPAAGKALLEYHEAVLRGDSPLSIGERELIAAYVSGLNACHYCHGVHSRTAEAFGISGEMMEKLLHDPQKAEVDAKLRPILDFVRKLTQAPATMTKADADAVYAAGWNERALHDAVNVSALFNFMNRLIDGHGLEGNAEIYSRRAQLLKEEGYSPLLKLLGF